MPTVQATISGASVRLLLDTGAARSLLGSAAVQRLGLRRDRFAGERVAGVGGGVSAALNAITGTIVLGGAELDQPEMAVAPVNIPVDGLLGADFWLRYDADLDLPHRRLTLYEASPCPRAAAPWRGPSVRLQGFEDAPPNRLLLPILLDGIEARAAFDTGAQASSVALRLAARFPPPPGGWQAVHVRGVNGAARVLPARRFARLQIGELVYADWLMPVLPLPPGPIEALVGEDLLHGCRTWFSFRARQVFVAAAPGDVLACRRSGP
ncbi:MAG TPA: retropepsin-like aspartic protease [Acetobacteraceae bacterium]|nr:retropepsin-like aspartic protease [Acetobacteraceae bacterium]